MEKGALLAVTYYYQDLTYQGKSPLETRKSFLDMGAGYYGVMVGVMVGLRGTNLDKIRTKSTDVGYAAMVCKAVGEVAAGHKLAHLASAFPEGLARGLSLSAKPSTHLIVKYHNKGDDQKQVWIQANHAFLKSINQPTVGFDSVSNTIWGSRSQWASVAPLLDWSSDHGQDLPGLVRLTNWQGKEAALRQYGEYTAHRGDPEPEEAVVDENAEGDGGVGDGGIFEDPAEEEQAPPQAQGNQALVGQQAPQGNQAAKHPPAPAPAKKVP